MSLDTRAQGWSSSLPRFRGGAAQILVLVLVALIIIFWLLLGDQLFSVRALQSMAFQLPELGILSLAMMVTLLSGGLNLSIIATANLCALAMAWVLTTHAAGGEGVMWVGWQVIAVMAGVAVGVIVGLINGFVIAYLGVSPILATLGTMTMCKGLSIGLTRGNVISGFPDPIVFLGNGTLMGVPVALLIFLALCVPVAVLLNKSPFGSQGLYDRVKRESDALFRGGHQVGAFGRLRAFQSSRGRRCARDDGEVQFRERLLRRELSLGDDPGGSARRRRSVRRLRQGRRFADGADRAPSDLLGLQSSQLQPFPYGCDLGRADPQRDRAERLVRNPRMETSIISTWRCNPPPLSFVSKGREAGRVMAIVCSAQIAVIGA